MTIPLLITASSLLTPLDSPAHSTFQAILAHRELLDRGLIPESTLASAPVPAPLLSLLTNPTLDKSIRLALLAAHRALAQSSWSPETLSHPRTALFVGTSKGPALTSLAALDLLRQNAPIPPEMARQITLGPAASATYLAEYLRLTGPRHTSVAACSSGLHALHRAAQALSQNDCDRALVVAADASVHPLFEASFQNLGVLAQPSPDAHRRCRPFSPEGSGFFLTEAAAALTLERPPQHPTPTGRGVILENTWIGADATHLLAIDPHTRSLRTGLHALTQSRPFDFIHAHATGTAHDAHELAALQSLSPTPPIFSSKRHLGHSLGAADLLSLVLSLQCHQHRRTLLDTPLPPSPRSLTISQGFGGHIALALLAT